MIVVIESIAECYPAIKVGLGLAGVNLLATPGLREQTDHPFLGAMLANPR